MMASSETIGMLHIEGNSDEVGSRLTQDLAHTLAEHLALSLSNLNLRDTLRTQSIRDVLTGLYNRRYMEESLERELHRALRKQSTVGIIMLDIDQFKNFNDTYGHDAGDAVLRELGVLLQRNVRGEDIACRFGGEEFILILPDTNLEVTHQRAEIIRQVVRSMNIEYRRQALGLVTVSLGVAVFPEHTTNFEEIVQKADRALYQAKHNGRDRVEIAQSDQ
jgi:diguanylate cyclase (GGDEF)-like protein